MLVTSKESTEKTKDYFFNNGYEVVIPYNELILTHEGGAPNGQLH